jgi:hypothetical protein
MISATAGSQSPLRSFRVRRSVVVISYGIILKIEA